jgi:copper chaperone NosL
MRIFRLISLVSFISILVACSVEPEPINFGEDYCVYCKMTISDPKYGAELVTSKGRVYKFDAIECLIPYMKENAESEFSHVMAIAYDKPEKLKNVDSLYFVTNEHFKSPMGKNLAAFVEQPQDYKSVNWKQLKNTFY